MLLDLKRGELWHRFILLALALQLDVSNLFVPVYLRSQLEILSLVLISLPESLILLKPLLIN
jgi:hypothetical protein